MGHIYLCAHCDPTFGVPPLAFALAFTAPVEYVAATSLCLRLLASFDAKNSDSDL